MEIYRLSHYLYKWCRILEVKFKFGNFEDVKFNDPKL